MNPAQHLHNLCQSLWLDNISRRLLNDGTLQRYIDELAVTGLTSNPTIFEQAVKNGQDYDGAIEAGCAAGRSGEELFFDLALDDIRRAADLFLPIFERTQGIDGWVSLEVSPLLARDARGTLAAAKELHARAGRPNVFIKIPGTPEGLHAIEEAIFAGISVNVTLLFSQEQYLAAAQAYRRGMERRLAAGKSPNVDSVASLFVSRWDAAVADKVPDELANQLGIAIARQTYIAYREILDDARWQRLFNAGVRPQRLLFASTGTKSPQASDILYVKALAAPFTINTMPEATLKALANHGRTPRLLSRDSEYCESALARFAQFGIDVADLATRLQQEGANAFTGSWNAMLSVIAAKSEGVRC